MSEFPHFKFNEPGLDEEECLAGYRAGLDGETEPGSDKSRSFLHGWRNGMADKGRLPISPEQRDYAESYVRARRAH
jgi:ribosome modulation factor